ncbi:hypothetical protein K443DRAFT_681465 [Laccaria amethystina LaAM-08-1]|uniref:Unplaced genomic scaffold K443scaffold_156, whole genome shotgun sequence n=1 Tax=Laccaria amethystina LaAM-08-1 TaxID=1095629 RepID=A0A0C9WXR0_9AGAR|nr:hypothetical protein K443DRAFT_681465 [Laccaria amethystina LaAM-08-1]
MSGGTLVDACGNINVRNQMIINVNTQIPIHEINHSISTMSDGVIPPTPNPSNWFTTVIASLKERILKFKSRITHIKKTFQRWLCRN